MQSSNDNSIESNFNTIWGNCQYNETGSLLHEKGRLIYEKGYCFRKTKTLFDGIKSVVQINSTLYTTIRWRV